MTLPKLLNFLVISLALSFSLIRTVASKPILTHNKEYDDQVSKKKHNL
jgi:hypothetical protein